MERLAAAASRYSPLLLFAVLLLLTLAALNGMANPLYILEGPVSGVVYGSRAELHYNGYTWVPGPLAAAMAVYISGSLLVMAGFVEALAGLVLLAREYARAGGYLSVVGFSIVVSGTSLIGSSLEPFRKHFVYETNLGVIDMGSTVIMEGDGFALLSHLRNMWPLIALLTLILAEFTSLDLGGGSGNPRNNRRA